MQRLQIFIILFLFPTIITAQNVYDTILYKTSANIYINDVYKRETFFYLIGNKGAYPNINSFIDKISEDGRIVAQHDFDFYNTSIKKIFDFGTGFILIGNSGINALNKMIILSVDYDFKYNWHKEYEIYKTDTLIELFIGSIRNEENEIVIIGSAGLNPFYDAKPFVFKTTMSGDSLYLKKGYAQTTYKAPYIFDLDTIPNTSKMLVSAYEFRENASAWETNIVKLNNSFDIDTVFRPLPINNSPYEGFWGNSSIKFLSDTTFIIAERKWIYSKEQKEQICIQLYDTTFNLYKETCWGAEGNSMDYLANWGLDFIDKNAIYVGGTSPIDFGPFNNHFILTKLNATLDIEWTKFYGGNASYRLDHVVATDDGGCLMVGKYRNLDTMIYDAAIILKVDANGNSSLPTRIDNTLSFAKDVIVYPNPTTGILNIQKGQQIKKAQIQIFDLSGRLIIVHDLTNDISTLNIKDYSDGIYIYKITNENEILDSGKIILK